MSLLVVSKILRPFVNRLTPDDKYSLSNKEILPQPIQFQLSKKLDVFFEVFTACLKSIFNFEYFEKKVEPHSLCISEIIDCEIHAYVNV